MTDAKAISTVYRGYRFRSRTEARWAVFFNAVGLAFEYEKEGFDLGDGIKYLPDFWLPELKLWVEIKGELNFEDNETGKAIGVYSQPVLNLMRKFRDSQEWPVACIFGQPGDHRIWFFAWDLSDSSGGNYEDSDAAWCVSNGVVTLNVHITSSDRHIYADSLYGPKLEHFTYARDHDYAVKPIERAITRARQARFEHGETPEINSPNVSTVFTRF